MFSDERNFKLWSGNQFMWVRRARGSNRFESKFTVKTVKHPAKVMVWGCFSFKGPGNHSWDHSISHSQVLVGGLWGVSALWEDAHAYIKAVNPFFC